MIMIHYRYSLTNPKAYNKQLLLSVLNDWQMDGITIIGRNRQYKTYASLILQLGVQPTRFMLTKAKDQKITYSLPIIQSQPLNIAKQKLTDVIKYPEKTFVQVIKQLDPGVTSPKELADICLDIGSLFVWGQRRPNRVKLEKSMKSQIAIYNRS